MKKKRAGQKIRKLWLATGIIAVVIFMIMAAANGELLSVIWHNLYSPSIKLEDSAEWEGGAAYEGLPYSEVSETDYLNLYVPEGEEPMPLLILVHGGGFVTNDCESRQAQFMYRYFRDHGYACASVNYRLAQEAAYPAAIEDVKAAVRFLRVNALKYGYDPERFAIWGESAGGYLAAMAAVTDDEEFSGTAFSGEKELEKQVSGQVSALVDFYGIVDFDLAKQDFAAEKKPAWLIKFSQIPLNRNLEGYETVEDLWLRKGVDTCTKEELAQMSARSYIAENFSGGSGLQVLIYHGAADLSVAHTQSERLAADFTGAIGEEKVCLNLFEGYKHADDRFYEDGQLEKVKEFLDKTFCE